MYSEYFISFLLYFPHLDGDMLKYTVEAQKRASLQLHEHLVLPITRLHCKWRQPEKMKMPTYSVRKLLEASEPYYSAA